MFLFVIYVCFVFDISTQVYAILPLILLLPSAKAQNQRVTGGAAMQDAASIGKQVQHHSGHLWGGNI